MWKCSVYPIWIWIYLLHLPQVPKADSNEGEEAKDDGEVGGEDEEEAEGGGKGDDGSEEEEAEKNQLHFSQPINFDLHLTSFRLCLNIQMLPFQIHPLSLQCFWIFAQEAGPFLGDDLACWLPGECPGKGWDAVFKRAEKMGPLDGASWCRHDPAIPYQVPASQLGSGKPVGFGLRGSGASQLLQPLRSC